MTDLGSIDRKVEWAEQHLGDLETELGDYFRHEPNEVIAYQHPNDPERTLFVLRVRQPIPDSISLRVGDIVHNLRSALDHLACRAAGRDDPAVAFPIWRAQRTPTTQDLKSLVKGKVDGATTAVIEQFLALEPHEGGNDEMLWCLDRLDIIDKHRLTIAALGSHESIHIDFGAMLRESLPIDHPLKTTLPNLVHGLVPEHRYPLQDGDVLFNATSDHITGDYPKFSLAVTLGEPKPVEGQPLSTVLPKLVEATKRTIDIFRPLL